VTRYLTLGEVVALHDRILKATGGTPGIRDLGALDSAVAQPKATFGGVDLYSTVGEKAAALCLSLVQNHEILGVPPAPTVDGTVIRGILHKHRDD
jgi:death-on-curing protein